MNDISIRFLEVYAYLKDAKKVSSQSDFAQKLDMSSSMITDIMKERTNPGINIIRNIVIAFPIINVEWLLSGVGEMVKSVSKNDYNPLDAKGNSGIVAESDVTTLAEKPKQSPTYQKDSYQAPKVITVDSEGSDSIMLVPVDARAGYLQGYGNPKYIAKLPVYKVPSLQNGTFRAFEVEGQSMVPTINHGDIVFAQFVKDFAHIIDDRIYVVVTSQDGILVKRLINRIHKYGFIVAKSDSIDSRSNYPNLKIAADQIIEIWEARMFMSSNFSSPHSIYMRINELEAKMFLNSDFSSPQSLNTRINELEVEIEHLKSKKDQK